MQNFNFKCPTQVVFGVGAVSAISDLCAKLGGKKVFVVSDPNLAKTEMFADLVKQLEEKGYPCTIYTDIIPEPPIEVVDSSADALKQSDCDIIVAVGGGSSLDIAKAMAMLKTNEGSVREYLFGGTKTVQNPAIPLICVSTTAGSGSEVTASSVISDTQNDIKLSVTHEYLFPRYAVVDPLMHKGMPSFITATTGMDALTHAIEAYTSLNANPISDAYAVAAIKLIAENLRTALANPNNIEARSNMAIASLMGAVAFVNGGLGAVHGISQAMGGVAHVAHGLANSLMLPYVMQRNMVGNLKRFAEIAHLMGENTDGLTLREAAELSTKAVSTLSGDLRIPSKLNEVGVTEDMFETIVKGTMEYRLLPLNPVKLCEKDVYEILAKAF